LPKFLGVLFGYDQILLIETVSLVDI